MRMDDVEVVGVLIDVRKHRELQVGSEFLFACEAQRLRTCRPQFCAGLRVAGGEQRYVMTAAHEFLGDV